MSAEIRTEHTVHCVECADVSGPYEDEEGAENWASEHDAAFHNEPDRDDDDRDHFLESLRDQG